MNDSFNNSDFDYSDEDNLTDEICDKNKLDQFASIAIPAFFSVVIMLSLVGNVLVLVIVVLYENLKSLTNIFILNLAMSDIVFTIGLPFWAISHVWGWIFTEILCKIVTFVFCVGFYSSILCLTIMTIYRYMAVVHPLSDLSTQNRCIGIFLSFLMWTVSIAAAMPSLLYSTVGLITHGNTQSQRCLHENSLIFTAQQNIIFLIAFVVMGFCYIQIVRRIRRTKSHTKNRAVKLVFCIVTVFFISWVPYNVVIFLRRLADNLVEPFHDCKVSTQLDYAFHVCRLIAFSHCCLNPVFYALVGVRFRSHLKSKLHRVFNRPNPVEEQQVRIQNFMSHGSMY